ncbi:MAG TPA: hypothetical protein VLX32_12630 [Candidatus Acidoferrum sp.]|nr:hypothetical protein [Candidatus Acidoferrum sp.]
MRPTSWIVYLQIDELIPSRGSPVPGLDEFSARLDHAGTPCVWLTNRTRLQIDEPRRKMAHTHPFIAEEGCGVYLPEDYFHLRPQSPRSGRAKPAETIRLGRFTCLPVAQPQPAASEALESLAAETGVSVVPLRSLPPRELAQNTGLQPREAELARQRDFDELFFFAGASAEQMNAFQSAARNNDVQLRQRGSLWSLAIGASTSRCIRVLSELYDRALHAHARTVGIATASEQKDLLSGCDRGIVLTTKQAADGEQNQPARRGARVLEVPLNSADVWDRLNSYLTEPR